MQLQQDLQIKHTEIQRETRKKEKVEREITLQKKDLENKTADIKSLQGQLQRGKDDYSRLEQQLKEQRVRAWTD